MAQSFLASSFFLFSIKIKSNFLDLRSRPYLSGYHNWKVRMMSAPRGGGGGDWNIKKSGGARRLAYLGV